MLAVAHRQQFWTTPAPAVEPKEVYLCAKKRMGPHVPRKRVGTARRTRTRRKSNHHTHNDTGANRAPVWSSAVLNDASDICLIEIEPGGTDRRASQRQQSYNYAGAPTFRASSAHHLANSVRKDTMSNATRLFCMPMKKIRLMQRRALVSLFFHSTRKRGHAQVDAKTVHRRRR